MLLYLYNAGIYVLLLFKNKKNATIFRRHLGIVTHLGIFFLR